MNLQINNLLHISLLVAMMCLPRSAICQLGPGSALSFNDQDNRIVYDNLLSDVQLPITISYWVKLEENSTGGNPVFTSCHNSQLVYYGFWSRVTLDFMLIGYGDGNGSLDPAYRRTKTYYFIENMENKWIHCAYVVRGSTDMDLYLNGLNVGGNYSGNGEETMVNGPECQFLIGDLPGSSGSDFFSGTLDEFRIWNYARTSGEIRRDMCRRLTGEEQGLMAYWKFDEGTGSTITELTSDKSAGIEGPSDWQISGAAIGDGSIYDYSLDGTQDTIQINDESNSFFISTDHKENWIGYQVYNVNEAPNSESGANIPLNNGYYGIYPIFSNGETIEFGVSLSTACSKGNYRLGNDDLTWKNFLLDNKKLLTSD